MQSSNEVFNTNVRGPGGLRAILRSAQDTVFLFLVPKFKKNMEKSMSNRTRSNTEQGRMKADHWRLL